MVLSIGNKKNFLLLNTKWYGAGHLKATLNLNIFKMLSNVIQMCYKKGGPLFCSQTCLLQNSGSFLKIQLPVIKINPVKKGAFSYDRRKMGQITWPKLSNQIVFYIWLSNNWSRALLKLIKLMHTIDTMQQNTFMIMP